MEEFMEYDVIDNFLSEEEFKKISEIVSGNQFPWFFNEGKVEDNDGYDQYYHIFYNQWSGVRTQESTILEPILKKLGANQIYKAKANMTSRKLFFRKTKYHIDLCNVTTAIFYINTNNGGTKLKGGPFIKSVANRILLFNSNKEHCGVYSSNSSRRLVLNINYT